MADSGISDYSEGALTALVLQGLQKALDPEEQEAVFNQAAVEAQTAKAQGAQDLLAQVKVFIDSLYEQTEYTAFAWREYHKRRAAGEQIKLTLSVYKNIDVGSFDALAAVIRDACMPDEGTILTEEQVQVVSNMLDNIDKVRKLLDHDRETREKFFELHKLAKWTSKIDLSFSMMNAVLAVGCLLAAAALTAATILSGGTALLPIIAVLSIAGTAFGGGAFYNLDSAVEMQNLDKQLIDDYLQRTATGRAKITTLVDDIHAGMGVLVEGFQSAVDEEIEQLEELGDVDIRQFANKNRGELRGLLAASYEPDDAHSDAPPAPAYNVGNIMNRQQQRSILNRYKSEEMSQSGDNQQYEALPSMSHEENEENEEEMVDDELLEVSMDAPDDDYEPPPTPPTPPRRKTSFVD